MKNLLVSLVISLCALSAQANVPISNLPAGTVITINQKLIFNIGQTILRVYEDKDIAVDIHALTDFVYTGLIVNSPVVLRVRQVSSSGSFVFTGAFNKKSLYAISVKTDQNFVDTLENLIPALTKAGITVQLPAPFEE